ncbi:conserved hypothetical protein [Vibrio crassostreae]|uniref:hypothetical protein n=1 Tax=Vibrio crassostreae TaxID=246167 RepID=UPI00105322C7|nr:hypothetical protein [Vibrio crassostreae]TCN78516.1 hypothetical protein EDB37_104232 [Vibrio crassostreae]CAK2421504.1 conserved hypothetical protein [Vibrio crassostreae]CAK2501213.1 conserved hypothetical protein [Vibrio crassostreae]CAK3025148.1 conserved hypothetical protein [Vibrio crassostreae]CAK3549048.1 conserved hypothetical protein [Vibrio crassostreae]
MAQQNSTPTLSNSNSSTSVSPLGHESSPKNDISGPLAVLKLRSQVKKCRNEAKRKSDWVSKIQRLKMFSRCQSPEQQADIAALKDQGFVEAIKQRFPLLGSRRFAFHEIRDFFIELNGPDFGEWFLHERAEHIILYTTYGVVFLALRFVLTRKGMFK